MTATFLVAIKFFLFDCCFLLSAIGLGSLIPCCKESSKLEKTFFFACLGMGIWSYSIFLLGLFGLLNKSALVCLFLLSLPFCFRILKLLVVDKRYMTACDWFFAVLVIVGTSTTFLASLYPPHTFDDTMYHLPTAQAFIDSNSLIFQKFSHFPLFNGFADLLFAGALGTVGAIGAQQISWVSSLLTAVGIFACLRSFVDSRAGLIGASVWFSSALVAKLSSIAFIDVSLGLFCLASTYSALILCLRTGSQRTAWILLTGLLCGCAVSTKLTGAIYTVGILLALLADGYSYPTSGSKRFREIVGIALVAGLVSLPWLIRNFVYSGNPFFPFMPNIFGLGNIWTIQDFREQMFEFSTHAFLHRDPITFFIQMPWWLSFNVQVFREFMLSYSEFFFFAFYLAIAGTLYRMRAFHVLTWMILLFLAVWFSTSQSPRYALPVLPAIAIISGWSAELLVSRSFGLLRFSSGKTVAICLLCCALAINGSFTEAKSEIDSYGRIPVTRMDQNAFITSQMPTYPAYQFLNDACPRGNLYALFDGRMSYYYRNGVFVGDCFGPARYSDVASAMTSGRTLYDKLKSFDIKYFLVNEEQKKFFKLPSDSFFTQHFIPLFKNKAVQLFVLTP